MLAELKPIHRSDLLERKRSGHMGCELGLHTLFCGPDFLRLSLFIHLEECTSTPQSGVLQAFESRNKEKSLLGLPACAYRVKLKADLYPRGGDLAL